MGRFGTQHIEATAQPNPLLSRPRKILTYLMPWSSSIFSTPMLNPNYSPSPSSSSSPLCVFRNDAHSSPLLL